MSPFDILLVTDGHAAYRTLAGASGITPPPSTCPRAHTRRYPKAVVPGLGAPLGGNPC
jgi:hypothetical protein